MYSAFQRIDRDDFQHFPRFQVGAEKHLIVEVGDPSLDRDLVVTIAEPEHGIEFPLCEAVIVAEHDSDYRGQDSFHRFLQFFGSLPNQSMYGATKSGSRCPVPLC